MRNPAGTYDVLSLNLGWFLGSSPQTEDVLAFLWIRLKGRDCPAPGCASPDYWPEATIRPPLTEEGLGQRILNNPGTVWLVGNEPDRRYYQDDVLPSQYAQAYHDVYHFIKERDPSALVAIGGIIQPTPLRLQYLDMILAEYLARYHEPMPVDVWNIHTYVIQEVKDSWGADIPPGIEGVNEGTLFAKSAHGDPAVFEQLVIDFRQWMKDRGRQDKPLIITEFGILFPSWLEDEYGVPFDTARVSAYMHQTMNWLESYADPALGYPADNHRLVQRWNWWSLDDDSTDPEGFYMWNGWLFTSTLPYSRTVFGEAFQAITSRIPPAHDLYAYRLRTEPGLPIVDPLTSSVSITLSLDIANPGNISVTEPFVVGFYERISSTLQLIATTTVAAPVLGCAGLATAEAPWSDVGAGVHQLEVYVDETLAISEPDETNNVWMGTVLVATDRVYLPLTRRD